MLYFSPMRFITKWYVCLCSFVVFCPSRPHHADYKSIGLQAAAFTARISGLTWARSGLQLLVSCVCCCAHCNIPWLFFMGRHGVLEQPFQSSLNWLVWGPNFKKRQPLTYMTSLLRSVTAPCGLREGLRFKRFHQVWNWCKKRSSLGAIVSLPQLPAGRI